jgi:hypothetical protein
MTSKDRPKGVDVEGSGLDLFYDTLTMFEEGKFMTRLEAHFVTCMRYETEV